MNLYDLLSREGPPNPFQRLLGGAQQVDQPPSFQHLLGGFSGGNAYSLVPEPQPQQQAMPPMGAMPNQPTAPSGSSYLGSGGGASSPYEGLRRMFSPETLPLIVALKAAGGHDLMDTYKYMNPTPTDGLEYDPIAKTYRNANGYLDAKTDQE